MMQFEYMIFLMHIYNIYVYRAKNHVHVCAVLMFGTGHSSMIHGLFQYPIRHVIVRSRKVSKQGELYT